MESKPWGTKRDIDNEAMKRVTKRTIARHVRMLAKMRSECVQERIAYYKKLSPEDRNTVLIYCMSYLESALGNEIQDAFAGAIKLVSERTAKGQEETK